MTICQPLLQLEKDQSYTGEAIFHYVMLKWPQKGLGVLKAKFLEKELSAINKNVKISISYITQMSQSFLEKCMVTPKNLLSIDEISKKE